jgi:zinc protease
LHPIPQGRRVGGSPEHIQTIARDELQQFWEDYYKPNNAILAIAGRFDLAEARKLIHQNFSQIPPGTSPPTKPPKSEAKTGTTQRVNVKPVMHNATGVAAIGYAAPLPGSKEYTPFLIVVSRLWAHTQNLFQPGKVLPVYYLPLDDPATIVLQTDLLANADTESALDQLNQPLHAALTRKLTPQDRQRTLDLMTMLLGTVPDAMWMQNLYGLAFSVGRRYQLKLDGNELRTAIQRVTDADMQHLATKLFAPEKRGTVIIELEK